MAKTISGIVGAVVNIVIAKGILLWLSTKGIYPEKWIAKMIGHSESAFAQEAIFWILLGFFGLIGLFIGPSVWGLGIKFKEWIVDSVDKGTNPKDNNWQDISSIHFENDELEIYKIAYLSLQMEPVPNQTLPPKVNARNSTLKQAIKKGKLKATLNGVEPTGYSTVNVQDFKSYSDKSRIRDFEKIADNWIAFYSNKSDCQHINLPNKISMLDFLKIAGKHGWDVIGDWTLMFDLVHGIKQAAVDGMKIYGREAQYHEAMTRDEILSLIPQTHWNHSSFRIEPMSAYKSNKDNCLTNDNFKVICASMTSRKVYHDVHLNRQEALEWLKVEAGQYKGKYKRDREK